ncbi:MAG: phage holin family protein [Patescibacteria group bacterium]|nr:phage holin family protein [Patescibacteria group bacterium]
MIKKLIIHILTNSIAIYIAVELVPGISFSEKDNLVPFLTAGFLLGLINFFVKPILKLISAPIIFFTFGLFTIAINIAMLLLLDYFVQELIIEGLSAAFWGMIVISAVNIFIGTFSEK